MIKQLQCEMREIMHDLESKVQFPFDLTGKLLGENGYEIQVKQTLLKQFGYDTQLIMWIVKREHYKVFLTIEFEKLIYLFSKYMGSFQNKDIRGCIMQDIYKSLGVKGYSIKIISTYFMIWKKNIKSKEELKRDVTSILNNLNDRLTSIASFICLFQ